MCPVYLDPASDLEKELNKVEDFLDIKDRNKTVYLKNAGKSLKNILKKYDVEYFDEAYIFFLVKLSLRLAAIYYTQIKLRDGYFKRRKQLKNSKKTMALFQKIITVIFDKNRSVEYSLIIEALERDKMWSYKFFCNSISKIFIEVSKKNREVLTEVFDTVENYIVVKKSLRKSKALLSILDALFADKYWSNEEHFLLRLLNLHITSIESHSPIRHGIELALRSILLQANNNMLQFVIEYIIEVYLEKELPELQLKKIEFSIRIAISQYRNNDSMYNIFKYETLINILTLISSKSKPKCIFGNITFQSILDTKNNINQLSNPKLFLMAINNNLRFSMHDSQNDEFVRQYRKELHLTFLTAIKNHPDDMKIIINIYTSIGLIMTEIPGEFTAAMLVCLIMNIQKNTLADREISTTSAHRIHAIVIALMSLICWITEAKMLNAYMDKILKLRAYNAPFLNPPLKKTYSYATHYVLWNKPEFFFENFEVRYALWKRFRLDERSTERPNPADSQARNRKWFQQPVGVEV